MIRGAYQGTNRRLADKLNVAHIDDKKYSHVSVITSI